MDTVINLSPKRDEVCLRPWVHPTPPSLQILLDPVASVLCCHQSHPLLPQLVTMGLSEQGSGLSIELFQRPRKAALTALSFHGQLVPGLSLEIPLERRKGDIQGSLKPVSAAPMLPTLLLARM